MRKILGALFLFFIGHWANAAFIPDPNLSGKAANCELHPLYCKIMTLQPACDPQWAFKLSNALIKQGKQYEMDPWLSLAIAMEESSLRNRHRNTKTIVFKESCDETGHCKKTHEVIHGHSDIGVFQFHVNTILLNDIDPVRLMEDLPYAVDWHYKILKQKQRQCEKEYGVEAWGCYHSRTRALHARYVKQVSEHYYGEQVIQKQKTTEQSTGQSLKESFLGWFRSKH